MERYVALLRGVNVGKGQRVPMAELRTLLTGLGYADVATILNSGNAVFRGRRAPSARHAAAIAGAIERRLGLQVPVIVKSSPELRAIIEGNPLDRPAVDHPRLLVAFTQDPTSLGNLEAVAELAEPPDEFVVGRHAAYLHCPQGSLQSKAGAALLGRAGRLATTRNWATTLKLQALLDDLGA